MYNFGKSEKKNYGLRQELVLSSWPMWQYGLWDFQAGSAKVERFLHKNKHIHYEKKLTKNIRPTDILQIYTSI